MWILGLKGLILGWHQGCDAVLNIKHGGTGTKTAFTLVQFYIDRVLFHLGYQVILLAKYPVFLQSAFVLSASKSTSTLV